MAADGRCSASSLLHLPQQPGAIRRSPGHAFLLEAASAAEPRSAVELGLQQMHVCLGWGGAESRHVPPTAASRLRGGVLSVRVPQVPCRLHAVCSASEVSAPYPPPPTPVTRQLRLRFLRRSDGSQISALKT